MGDYPKIPNLNPGNPAFDRNQQGKETLPYDKALGHSKVGCGSGSRLLQSEEMWQVPPEQQTASFQRAMAAGLATPEDYLEVCSASVLERKMAMPLPHALKNIAVPLHLHRKTTCLATCLETGLAFSLAMIMAVPLRMQGECPCVPTCSDNGCAFPFAMEFAMSLHMQ